MIWGCAEESHTHLVSMCKMFHMDPACFRIIHPSLLPSGVFDRGREHENSECSNIKQRNTAMVIWNVDDPILGWLLDGCIDLHDPEHYHVIMFN